MNILKKLNNEKFNKYKLFVFVESIDMEDLPGERSPQGEMSEINAHLRHYAADVYKSAVTRKKGCNRYININ